MSTQVKRGREKSRSIETSPPSRHSHQSRHYLRQPYLIVNNNGINNKAPTHCALKHLKTSGYKYTICYEL